MATKKSAAARAEVNLDDLRRLREEAMAAGAGSGRWITAAQVLMNSFPAYYETAKGMNLQAAQLRAALALCVQAMLRMIPDYCGEQHAEPCTDEEHDAAIAAAATALYGPDRARWPAGVRAAAEGRYA